MRISAFLRRFTDFSLSLCSAGNPTEAAHSRPFLPVRHTAKTLPVSLDFHSFHHIIFSFACQRLGRFGIRKTYTKTLSCLLSLKLFFFRTIPMSAIGYFIILCYDSAEIIQPPNQSRGAKNLLPASSRLPETSLCSVRFFVLLSKIYFKTCFIFEKPCRRDRADRAFPLIFYLR